MVKETKKPKAIKKIVTKPKKTTNMASVKAHRQAGAKEKPKVKAAALKQALVKTKPLLKTRPSEEIKAVATPAPVVETKSKPVVSVPRRETKSALIRPLPSKETIVVTKAKTSIKEPVVTVAPSTAIAVEYIPLELELPVTLKDLAVRLQEKPSVLIKKLLGRGLIIGINQTLKEELVFDLCRGYGFEVKKALGREEAALEIHRSKDAPQLLQPRPPVVTFMGHVDHGKTSLLDRIKKTNIAQSEFGGITQHIGASQINVKTGSHLDKERKITFLDTPGHEAFTQMRSRGARITDIVVLVVAADDGMMPQTLEAIDHAREANVPIIVAINKIDKPQANLERVKKQLAEHGLTPEDWQGKTITLGVSAKTGEKIDELLEMILLEAEMLELKANYQKAATGVVVEANLSKGRGPVATVLVQNGTLRLNDNLIVGHFYAKVKAIFNHYGQAVREATPSTPVEILGLSGVPEAGEQFFVITDERIAKEVARAREEKARQNQMQPVQRISLENLYAQIKEGAIKELKIILKADVMGSLEAIKESLKKIETPEIKLTIIHGGVGDINSSDVILAAASNALILGFNVGPDLPAKELITREGVDLRNYNIIYELSNDLKAALEGMLEPKIKKLFVGRAEVRKVFTLSSSGVVAGCFVSKGKILRSSTVNLMRNGESVFEGKISALKRFKDDVKEVGEGVECGISLVNFQEIKEGDVIEACEIQKIARKIE